MRNIDKLIEYIERSNYLDYWQLHREKFGDYIVSTYEFLLNRIREKGITRMSFDMSNGYRAYINDDEVERYAMPIGLRVPGNPDQATTQPRFIRKSFLATFYAGLLEIAENDEIVKQFITINRLSDEAFEVTIDYS